ncbi:MAG: hypothetical protein AAF437_12385 [Pseudomonadota bacterium]
MIKFGLMACLAFAWLFPAMADEIEDRERRLKTVTVTALPPDKGELHINPIIRRAQDFLRPGYSEMELVFVPVALIEDRLEPLLGEENREYLRLVTDLPERPEGIPFEDTAKEYFTQSVILPRGYYVLSEITFRQRAAAGVPDLQAVSHCLADESFMLHVKGGDVMYMGRPEFEYPSAARVADPDFNPAAELLAHLDWIDGWRWTTKDLTPFQVIPTSFQRTTAFCSPQAVLPGS